MQLRTFSLYAKTAAQSVYAYPCTLVDFDGNLISGASGLFLQFHDKATAATVGNVPIKSFLIPNASSTPLASIFQALGPITFALGLSIGISTTEATYTAATATFDIFGEIEESLQATDGISGLTSTTVGSDTLATIFNGGLPKRLFSLTITNGEGATCYVMLTQSGGSNGQSPLIQLPGSIANGATQSYYFGDNGYTFPSNLLDAKVVLSTTPTVITQGTGVASTFVIKTKT